MLERWDSELNEVAATHQHSHTLIAFCLSTFQLQLNESYFSLKQRIYVKEHDDNRSKYHKENLIEKQNQYAGAGLR